VIISVVDVTAADIPGRAVAHGGR